MSTRRALGAAVTLLVLGMTSSAPAVAYSDVAASPKFDSEILALGASPRAIVGFSHDVTATTMRRLARAGITHAVRLDTIDAVGVLGAVTSYRTIASWDDVVYVDSDSPLQLLNYSAKKDTGVTKVRSGKPPVDRKYTGKGVVVAVIDTGIDSTHPDLDDRVIKHVNFEPSWFFDMINDGVYSDQLSETTGNPIDSYGHGTHVAGIVAGTGEAAEGADMSGVAPGAKLVNLKIADVHEGVDCTVPCDFGWELNALVAYEYMIEHRNDEEFGRGIRIATNSWSIFEVDSEVEPITLIVQAAARKGLINLFAASNDGPDENSVAPGPNSLEEVITVAAACKSDGCGLGTIANFSSRGPQVDVAAPGVAIYSTWARASAFGPIGDHTPPGAPANAAFYVAFDGTSMATPHVAGIVALMLEANSDLTYRRIERILTSTATDYGTSGFDTAFGFGEVNALKAVARAERLR
jgi:serine protease AprX